MNVCGRILDDALIGLMYTPGNLSREMCLEVLESTIEELNKHELEYKRGDQDNLAVDQDLQYFQQDGTPPNLSSNSTISKLLELTDAHNPYQH